MQKNFLQGEKSKDDGGGAPNLGKERERRKNLCESRRRRLLFLREGRINKEETLIGFHVGFQMTFLKVTLIFLQKQLWIN